MRVSDLLIDALKRFEGLRLCSYKDSAGVWTIGYGHTGGIRRGMKITSEEAEVYLRDDVSVVESQVNGLHVCRSQGEFDALVSFVFNLGIGRLKCSTLLKKIRAGASCAQIQSEFRRWVYCGGKVLPGLVSRREWEARRWVS